MASIRLTSAIEVDQTEVEARPARIGFRPFPRVNSFFETKGLVMKPSARLRLRLLSVLSSGALFAPLGACSNGDDDGSITPSSTMCSGQQGEVQCFDPGTTHFNVGNVPDDAAPPTPTPEFDSNRCQVRAQVRDSCCNAAVTGPSFQNSQCCYGFCTGACCGRPLLVAGEARVAAVVKRDDWLESLSVAVAPLNAVERAELAEAWLEDAALEHASIASFARFVLDLLAFGAPADLVEDAQRAMGDEIRHARLCFSVAAAYSGEKLGPGPIPMHGVSVSSSLAEAAAAALREGSIGETIAALALEERARSTALPALGTILRAIGSDEANHAELAWKFVRWALSIGGHEVHAAVEEVLLQSAPAPSVTATISPSSRIWRDHGRLTPSELDRVSVEAWREVIGPCAKALDDSVRPPAPAPATIQA